MTGVLARKALDKTPLYLKNQHNSMNATLLLNASYEPLRIISWKKALTLFFAGKVEVIEEYEHQVHAITFAIKLPSIIRLLKYVRVKKHNRVKFSRANIYARDDYTCQYCGKKFPSEDLTFDHVVPSRWADKSAGITSSRLASAVITGKAAGRPNWPV